MGPGPADPARAAPQNALAPGLAVPDGYILNAVRCDEKTAPCMQAGAGRKKNVAPIRSIVQHLLPRLTLLRQ
jgi:hypothetical protein